MKKHCFVGLVFGVGILSSSGETICAPVIQWQKSFGTSSYEYSVDVHQTADSGFVVGGVGAWYVGSGGNKTSPNYGQRDYWVIRTDANGNKLWDRSYGGSGDEVFAALQQTSDGGFIIAGTSWYESIGGNKTSTNYGTADFWVLRTDAAGNVLWDQSFGGTHHDILNSVVQTADGGFVLAGSSLSDINEVKTAQPLGGEDFWLVRLDPAGNKLWDRAYGGGGNDSARVVRQTSDGGFLVGGTSESPGTFGGEDYRVVRLSANGDKLWDKFFGGEGRDNLASLTLTPGGGCVLGGTSDSRASGNKTSTNYGAADFWAVRLDASGNKLWDRSYGGSDEDTMGSISATADGGLLMAGASISPVSGSRTATGLGEYDFWLVRVDANGDQMWDAAYGGSAFEACRVAAQTTDRGYILLGDITSMDGDRSSGFGANDFWLVKLTEENADDCDNDGVPNAQDQCPGTALGASVNAQGCSIQQLCPCDMDSHDLYVACVRAAAREFHQAGLIDNAHRHQLIENARMANCPPDFGPGEAILFGLPHRKIGPTEIIMNPGWFPGIFLRHEEESLDPYGISIALGEADSGLFIYPGGNQSNYGESWFFDVTAYGRKDHQSGDDLISSIHVRKPYYEYYPINVDLSPLEPESVTIQVLSNLIVVAEQTIAAPVAEFQVNGYAYLQPRGNPYWRMPDGSVGVLVEFTNPSAVSQTCCYGIGIDGSQVFFGDQIFVRANRPRRQVQYVSRVDAVLGGGVPGLEVQNERLGVFGHGHQALGSVMFNAARGRLQVSGLDVLGSEDLAAVLVEAPRNASRLEVDLDAVELPETGAGLTLFSSGVIGLETLLFGEVRISREAEQLAVTYNFQTVFEPGSNAPLVRIDAFQNGRLSGTSILPGTTASGYFASDKGRSPEITGCRTTINSNGVPSLGIGFAKTTTLSVNEDVHLVGNHFRITPVNSTQPVTSVAAITIEMVQLQSITIMGERSEVVAPALSIHTAGEYLVLTWPDATRLYGLEVASSPGGPFSAVTNEVSVVSGRNTLTVPIGSEGAQFFRLNGPRD